MEINRDRPKYVKLNMKLDARWRLLKAFPLIQSWNNLKKREEIN